MKRFWLLCAAVPLLAGCGPQAADLAVSSCEKEIALKVAGKSWELDRGDMAAQFKRDGNIAEITSKVTFDRGLPDESAQAFTCRVQYDPGNAGAEPAVIGLTFVW